MLIRTLAISLVLASALMTPALAQTAVAATSPSPAPAFEASHAQVPAPDGRTIDMSVWTAPDERGVIVFSTGIQSPAIAYRRILSAWVAHGYTVVAPLHVDAPDHPHRDDYDRRAAFVTRIMDVAVARGFARATHPGKPIIAAGHSFGSLMSMIEGGAETVAGQHGDSELKGIIAFSSPGIIPGVITPKTYETLTAPMLLITGDKDLVPGFVTDWRDHRAGFDGSPVGDKTLMLFHDGDHQFVARADDADFALVVEATEDFLDAYALGDAAAKARLAALPAPDGVTIERR